MEVVDPKLLMIETENRELRERVLVLEAKHEELSRKANSYTIQTTWQFISFAITMVVTVLGAVYYQTKALIKSRSGWNNALTSLMARSRPSRKA